MKWVALMPLRGGSKSIPKKNIKEIAGKPLFFWSLQAAVQSEVFDRIFVSTDSSEIGQCVTAYFGDKVSVLDRPAELATDQASTESVMLHLLDQGIHFDVLGLIQATSPLTSSNDFREAKVKFESEGADSLVTGVQWRRFVWDQNGKPINYNPSQRPRRQDFSPWFLENGAFYFTKREVLANTKSRLGDKISLFEMDEATACEIDEPSDWGIVESLLIRRRIMPSVAGLKLLVVDVDGTLTDGGMYYGPDGEALKRFDTRDWSGLKMLEASGVPVCIMTAEDSPSVHARLKKVPLSHYHFGVEDKVAVLSDLLGRLGVGWDQVGYIGDDVGDLEGLKRSGFSACPQDATDAAKKVSHYICKNRGGFSAVREVCDLILAARLTP